MGWNTVITNFMKRNPFYKAHTHLANYPHFTGPQVSLRGHTAPPLVPISRQMTAVHTILLHLFKSHSHNILPSTLVFASRLHDKNHVSTYISSHAFQCPTQLMPHLITLILFGTKHKPCSSSQSNILSFLPPSIFLSTLLSKILSLRTSSSLNLKDHVSYPYKTTNTVAVLYALTEYAPCIR